METALFCFVRNLIVRMNTCYYVIKARENDKCCWHSFLLDCDKKDLYLERSNRGPLTALDIANYGKVISSGWGHDIPSNIINMKKKFLCNFTKNFFLLRIKTDKITQTYYVLSDDCKENEMRSASSVSEIRRCGIILYSSFDEDPPEALAYVLEAKYFDLASAINWNIDSPFDAVLNGDMQSIQDYLNSGKDINCTDSRGWTLLHHFAHRNEVDVISFLKSKGADIHVRDKICGRKPIHIAAREGHKSAMEYLLKNGAIVNERDTNNWTLLHYAARKGDVNVVKFLINNSPEINAKDLIVGKKPIHIAAEYGHTDVVETLLENNVSVEEADNSDRTPLYYAAMGHIETTKFLIAKGADINKKTKIGTLPIHAAFDSKVINLFLGLRVNVDEPDDNGDTPLHLAVFRNCFELVKFLINNKANPYAVNKNSETPVDLSAEYTDILLYLADKVGALFEDEEKYDDALKHYRGVLKILTAKLGSNHPETLKTRNREAKVLYKKRQYDAAATHFKDLLEAREKCLGGSHYDTLDTKHGLGLVYYSQIKYDAAMEIFREVYEKREASLGACHHDTLNVARDMALVHFRVNEHAEAYEILKDLFEKRRAHFGEDHQDTLQVELDMAVVLVNKGEYKMAMQTFKDVLQKRKRTLGDDHPDTLLARYHISIVSKKFESELKESSGCLMM